MIPHQIDTRDFFLRDLLDKLNPDEPDSIRLQHPFVLAEIRGAGEVSAALDRLAEPLSSLCGAGEYYQPGLAARCWDADFEGRKVRGVTAVSVPGSGAGIEAAILLSTYPSASQWREQARADSSLSVPKAGWELPAGANIADSPADPESGLDPKLPFPIAEDMVFHSPILSKPVHGPELISRVFAHTSAIYGDRKYGPKLQAGRNVVSFWEASISGFTIQVANEIRFNGKREVDEMVMSMRPWPVVKLFRDRCLARTHHFLDVSYFET